MKVRRPVLFALGVSLAGHVAFLLFAATAKVYHLVQAKQEERLVKIKTIKEEKPPEPLIVKPVVEKELPEVESIKLDRPVMTESLVSFIDTTLPEEMIEKESALTLPPISKPISMRKREETKFFSQKEFSEMLIRPQAKRETRSHLVELEQRPVEMATGAPEDLEAEAIPSDFLEEMPGFTPKAAAGLFDAATKANSSNMAKGGATPGIKRHKPLSDLKEYLDYELASYTDKDGQKYFKISIRVAEAAANLKTAAKELIFLIDCSISINKERLEEFKRGVEYCLKKLNPEDRFNVIAFKESLMKFSNVSVVPDELNVRDALKFISDLTAGGKTDTYEALYETITQGSSIQPAYIIFLSDGKPTRGVTDSRRLINEISEINAGRIGIFSFSGGVGYNRYLLDFISYKNRGWSEYAQRNYFIGKNIGLLYDKIKDPILLNLRYHLSGIDDRDIFPKILPDFFRNAEFTLYGRYTEETDFLLQLLGDYEGQSKEFIAQGTFQDADPGERDIARNWAFNKVYHLIGLLQHEKDNTQLIKEINYLCKKFEINTPYLKNLKE